MYTYTHSSRRMSTRQTGYSHNAISTTMSTQVGQKRMEPMQLHFASWWGTRQSSLYVPVMWNSVLQVSTWSLADDRGSSYQCACDAVTRRAATALCTFRRQKVLRMPWVTSCLLLGRLMVESLTSIHYHLVYTSPWSSSFVNQTRSLM